MPTASTIPFLQLRRARRRLRRSGVALLLLLAAVAWFAGCQGYAGDMFRENMLKPTPDEPAKHHPKPKQWSNDQITVAWIGHSTVLINFYGTVILTDPVLGRRLAPPQLFSANLGIRRIVAVPLSTDDLPPVDLILLSHAHYDHWDQATLSKFSRPTVAIIPEQTRDLLPPGHFDRIEELPWNQSTEVKGVNIRAVHVYHWGERGSENRLRGYNGYVLSARGKRIFFAGDSAYGRYDPTFGWMVQEPWEQAVGAPVDLSILPIGNYAYLTNHMNPEQAWDIHRRLRSKWLLPIHWATFILSPRDIEPIEEPIQRLKAAADRAAQIICDEQGKTFVLPDSP